MSLGKDIAKVLGIIAGIFIPGANKDATNLTHTIQQDVADWAGAAAKDLAAKLALDTTGMSGADKIWAIAKALVETAEAKGIKADADILFAVLLDVAQAAYRASLPNFETAIVAVAAAFSSNPLVGTIAELVGETVEALVEKWGGPSPSSTGIASPAKAA